MTLMTKAISTLSKSTLSKWTLSNLQIIRWLHQVIRLLGHATPGERSKFEALSDGQRNRVTGFRRHPTIATFYVWALSSVFILTTISTGLAEDLTITVERGTPFPLVIESPFDMFLVDNPAVLDVHTRGDRSVIAEGLAPGASNIVFIDEQSIAIANIRIVVCDAGLLRVGRDETDCEKR